MEYSLILLGTNKMRQVFAEFVKCEQPTGACQCN